MEEYRDIETLNAYAELKTTGKWTEEELLAKMQYGSRDCGRVPMPWNNEKEGGFTTGTPWIKTQADPGYTVAEQEKDPKSVLNFYRKLFELRKNIPALADGEFKLLWNEDDVSVYTRTAEGVAVYVVCNFSAEKKDLPDCFPHGGAILLNNYDDEKAWLRPYQALWIQTK